MILGMSVLEFVVVLIIFLMFLSISGFVLGRYLYKLRWPFQYVLMENVQGQGYIPTRRGRCRKVKFSKSGTEIYFIKGLNVYRAGYGKRIGKNQIMWVAGSDGYWYNSNFGDFEKRQRELGIEPIDRDMRYAESQIVEKIENRYNDKTFMDKYGTMIAFGMLIVAIIIFGIVMYIAFNQQAKITVANGEALETSKEVMNTAKEIIASLDNLQARQGSGFVSGGTT